MNTLIASMLAVLLAACTLHVSAAPSPTSSQKASKQELYILAKILQPLRQLVNDATELEAVIVKELPNAKISEAVKRQSAWDLDYGWGGGRFGKRGEAKKRYDMYGFGGGRFGRDVDHVDVDGHH